MSVCREYNQNNGYNDDKKYKYKQKKKHYKKKNTECFKPCHEEPDMRIIFDTARGDIYPRQYKSNEVIYVQNLFDDSTIYEKLLEEIQSNQCKSEDLFKLWHGDSHVIADDKKNWKKSCPTFNMIIDKLASYFKVDVKATRFNWYRNNKEWKPFHHDAAAIKPDKAKTQNITIAVSFGSEREAAFQHAKDGTILSLPLTDGSIYIFNKDVNIEWKHGILQVPPEQEELGGRVSIIIWGWVDNMINIV